MKEPTPRTSAAAEVLAYEKRVNAAMRSMQQRTHWEPATDVTPLHHLLASEDEQLDEWGVINETARRILGWIGSLGPSPAAILLKCFARWCHRYPSAINCRRNSR